MIYSSASDWTSARNKRVMLFGMSGLGKTYISNILRDAGNWFHYSVDYRIGTRYMGEHIVDNFKAEAMRNPFLEELLRSDSIYIASNIRFDNLAPLSTYLGKPGNSKRGGIPFLEYCRRQDLHRAAEINAMKDTEHFVKRSHALYNYDNFVCDTSGSLVEVADGNNPQDEVLNVVGRTMLPVWIKGDDSHLEVLAERFAKAPKPMYYQPDFLTQLWGEYLDAKGCSETDVDPDDFITWGYRRLLQDRLPRYQAIADNWGITVDASKISQVSDAQDFNELIAQTLDEQNV